MASEDGASAPDCASTRESCVASAEPSMAETLPIRSSAPMIDHSQGLGLGTISDDMFEPSRWYPSAPVLAEQYTKFVNVMLGRIRANESNAHEARLFFELLRTGRETGFWKPVDGFLPALEEGVTAASSDHNEPYLLLVTFLRLEARERKRQGRARSESGGVAARTGLDKEQQDDLATQIYGKESTSSSRTTDQNRLLKSWFEIGYPAGVMAEDEAKAAANGQTIQKDSLGLPISVGTESASEWASASQADDKQDEEPPKHAPALFKNAQNPQAQRPVLRHHPYSGFAEARLEAKQKSAPKLAPDCKEDAPSEPVVIKGFDPVASTELQLKDPNADVSGIGQQLKERDLQSPYDSSLASNPSMNDLSMPIPQSSYDESQQHGAYLSSGEAFASQISQPSSIFIPNRFSEIDADTPPRSLLTDEIEEGVSLRTRNHGSEVEVVEVVVPSPNSSNSALQASSIPHKFFDHLDDPLKINPLDRLP